MGIWMHIPVIPTIHIPPDLGEMAKSLHDLRVQMMPYDMVEAVESLQLHPISILYIKSSTLSNGEWEYGCTLMPCLHHHKHCPRFGRVD